MFSGGKGGHCPPILARLFSTDQKGGRGLSTPKYLVLQRKLIANAPENAGKRYKTPENAGKCRKMPENAAKCRKMPQNAANDR
jgi:hypothetical protein